jgi:hypothetical protein
MRTDPAPVHRARHFPLGRGILGPAQLPQRRPGYASLSGKPQLFNQPYSDIHRPARPHGIEHLLRRRIRRCARRTPARERVAASPQRLWFTERRRQSGTTTRYLWPIKTLRFLVATLVRIHGGRKADTDADRRLQSHTGKETELPTSLKPVP